MPTTVTAKGQVTIPKPVRDLLGLTPGSQVEFDLAPNGSIVLSRTDGKPPISPFAKWLGHAGPGMTTDEVMALTRGEE